LAAGLESLLAIGVVARNFETFSGTADKAMSNKIHNISGPDPKTAELPRWLSIRSSNPTAATLTSGVGEQDQPVSEDIAREIQPFEI
jgi:hypothetical protein